MASYPKYKYHATEPPIVVHTHEEETALGDTWKESPADHAKQIIPPQRRKRRTTQE